MENKNELPKIEKKKEIDSKKFEILAKKVRQYFEEEARYIHNHTNVYGNNKSTKLTFSSQE